MGRQDAAVHSLGDVGEGWIRWSRSAERIEVEAERDGMYIIRTTLKAEQLGGGPSGDALPCLLQ